MKSLPPSFSLYSTLSRRREVFVPLRAGHIGLYVCGMTVYDLCHMGHARAMLAFDVIVRYLRGRGWQVRYIRNITDIDDKILQRASESGETIEALTARMIGAMTEDFAALGLLAPDEQPRATEHISGMISMIQRLIEQGHAYVAENADVYYRVASFDDYGKLSGRSPDELLSGARVEVDEHKDDPRDFALWKAAKPGEVSWDSPWGKGRPGWHIECSVMSTQCLGATFDIHGGGPDLVFPHHENEIAQSEAANGVPYARYWLHAGALRVNDEKMSKSLGNFFTIRDVLREYPAEVVRYLLVSSHYRSPINWSDSTLAKAREGLTRLYQAIRPYAAQASMRLPQAPSSEWQHRFYTAMDDDFNTTKAIAVLHEMVRELNTLARDNLDAGRGLAAEIKALGGLLGLLQRDPVEFLQQGGGEGLDDTAIASLIAERQQAKQARDYRRADAIREQLAGHGVVLEDSRDGTRWRREPMRAS